MKLLLRISSLTIALGAATACGDSLEPSGGKKADADAQPKGGVKQETTSEDAANLEAFKDTVYPLVNEHCSQCHASITAPNFANADVATALKTIESAQLVNLSTPPASRLVKRLTEQNHKCWDDCKEDGAAMSDAIAAWAAKSSGTSATDEFVKLTSVPIASAGEVTLRGGFDKTWVFAAAYPDGYGDRLAPFAEPRASQRSVMYQVPDFATLPEPKPQGGAFYSVNIPDSETETYQLCFRVKTNIAVPGIGAPQGGTRVFATINGRSRFGAVDLNAGVSPRDPTAQQQIGTSYVWMPAFYAVDASGATVPAPVNLRRLNGSKSLELNIADTEPAIDLIALTANVATCPTSAAPNSGRIYGFQYDLTSALGGTKATLTLSYQKSADGLAQVFTRPTIEVEDPGVTVHVEGLYVVINDTLDRQLNTFASIKADVKGGAVLSTADLIVPPGADGDKVGIYISKLSVAKP